MTYIITQHRREDYLASMLSELPGRKGPLSLVPTLAQIFSWETASLVVECSRWDKFHLRTLVQEENTVARDLLFVLSGGVKLTKIQSDKKRILDIAGPLELIGAPLILSSDVIQKFPVRIETLAMTEILWIDKNNVHNKLLLRDDFSKFVSNQMSRRIQRLQSEIFFGHLSVKARIADFFLHRLGLFPHLKMTREEIAQAVSTTNESVIRILTLWEKQEIVRFEKQSLVSFHQRALSEIFNEG